MNDLKQFTVYFATDGSATPNDIKMALAEKLAEVLIERAGVGVVYEFEGNRVYEMSAWVKSHD